MKTLEDLLAGYQQFFTQNFVDHPNPIYTQLAEEGQAPRVMVLSCSDSRVDPATITQAGPGEIFACRNVANLVPPYHRADGMEHGTVSALEYGVCNLGVEHLVVMGHTHCGGIRALMEQVRFDDNSFVPAWLAVAEEARAQVSEAMAGASLDDQAAQCEKVAIAVSLNNLLTYPWIEERVRADTLTLHGWRFNIHSGALEQLARLDHMNLLDL